MPPLTNTPGQPLTQTTQVFLDSIYTMFFRKDTNHLQNKNFKLTGDLKEARERAQKHCSIIGAKLMFVQPFICNLTKEEDFILNGAIKSEVPQEEKKLS